MDEASRRTKAASGKHQGHRPGAAHRAGRPHVPVPAVQHSVRLADPDAADRRLPVRLEIHLRLFQAIRFPFSPPLFSGPRLGSRAEARRHRRLQAAEGQLDRLHQARHRPARRPHPDDRRRAQHQRQAGEARARRRTIVTERRLRPHAVGAAVPRDAAERRHATTSSSSTATTAICDNTAGLHGAARPLLHDGRQPRQLDRQPRASRASASCRSRTWSAAPRSSSSRSTRSASRLEDLEVALDACAGTGCSTNPLSAWRAASADTATLEERARLRFTDNAISSPAR